MSDICTKNLKVVKIKDPETQSRKTKEDLAYNNRVILGASCNDGT